jgi:hypothetical protein
MSRGAGGAGANLNMRDSQNGNKIQVTSIDNFVQNNNLTVGFIKADVEGYGLKLAQGGIKILKRDRPIFSISTYHNFGELFEFSAFLLSQLPDYEFEWHMENPTPIWLFELSLFGYPKVI